MKDEQQESSGMEGNRLPLRQRTKSYALRIIKVYTSLPKDALAQVLGKQLLRSGTSVGANYREGFRARSNAELIAKFGICIQELEECAYWMELLVESSIVSEQALAQLLDETNQLIAMLVSAVKRLSQTKGKV